jgi:multicopper oxidase
LNTITPLGTPKNTRELALYEGEDSYGRLIQNLGTLAGPADFSGPITEVIKLGDKEIWKIYNTTADTHPIHLHQVSFQILGRQKFNWKTTESGGIIVTGLQGQLAGPGANEAGWKDTARMNPGEVTIIEARFDLPGKYVWHCHILEHEEHDMMRFFEVVPSKPASLYSNVSATVSKPIDVSASSTKATGDSTPAAATTPRAVVNGNKKASTLISAGPKSRGLNQAALDQVFLQFGQQAHHTASFKNRGLRANGPKH